MTARTQLLSVFFLLFLAPPPLGPQTRIPVWIDTDPSVERGGHEVDDGFALIQAFHSPELDIRGVSVVFGNADLPKAWQIGKEIVERFGPAGLRVYRGASGSAELGKPTDASEALTLALRQGPLHILAIGPVTNVATVLQLHPELAKNVVQIIAVAGRRPGQRFAASPTQAQSFRDFNFELDTTGFQVLLDARVPIVLAPWEVSSKVWLRRNDIDRLTQGGRDVQYLLAPALDWLQWWHENLGVEGFNPFDTLAVGYVTSPQLFACEESNVQIQNAPDDVTSDAKTKIKPYLYVSAALESPRRVTYCYSVSSSFKEDLLERLLNNSSQKETRAMIEGNSQASGLLAVRKAWLALFAEPVSPN
jgi:pyrimidine-specific ribonucleoside hydrolase